MPHSRLAQKENLKFNFCFALTPKAYGSNHIPFWLQYARLFQSEFQVGCLKGAKEQPARSGSRLSQLRKN